MLIQEILFRHPFFPISKVICVLKKVIYLKPKLIWFGGFCNNFFGPALTDFVTIICACFVYMAFDASGVFFFKKVLTREVWLGRQQGDYLSQTSAGRKDVHLGHAFILQRFFWYAGGKIFLGIIFHCIYSCHSNLRQTSLVTVSYRYQRHKRCWW